MKLTKLILIIFMIGYYSASSQSFIVKRTDVNNDSAKFVTATYNFSFEIFLSGVPNSNSISFKLNYNFSEFIKFSQWKQGDYNVLQAVPIDNGDGTSSLVIGVSSGLNPQSTDKITPKVIELEFVVTKNAPNLNNLIMSFERPVATLLGLEGGENVDITADNLDYIIHSYVNVWPGDTDHNGYVDHLDFVPISQYIGMGSATKGFRSFKRATSSALWTPQRVLTWDSALVTHVDCDGNADITTTDMLIVTYNLGKDTLKPHGVKKIQKNPFAPNNNDFHSDNQTVNFNVDNIRDFTGFAGTILNNSIDNELIEVRPGNILPQNSYVHFFKNGKLVHFVISNPNLDLNTKKTGTIFELVFNNQSKNSEPDFQFNELQGIDRDGSIFSINTITTDVAETKPLLNYTSDNGILYIETSDYINDLSIIDLNGNVIYFSNPTSNFAVIDLSRLNSGVYIINAIIGNQKVNRKINLFDKKITISE